MKRFLLVLILLIGSIGLIFSSPVNNHTIVQFGGGQEVAGDLGFAMEYVSSDFSIGVGGGILLKYKDHPLADIFMKFYSSYPLIISVGGGLLGYSEKSTYSSYSGDYSHDEGYIVGIYSMIEYYLRFNNYLGAVLGGGAAIGNSEPLGIYVSPCVELTIAVAL